MVVFTFTGLPVVCLPLEHLSLYWTLPQRLSHHFQDSIKTPSSLLAITFFVCCSFYVQFDLRLVYLQASLQTTVVKSLNVNKEMSPILKMR